MSEKQLDSSTNNYINIVKTKKSICWDAAIGLQDVDGLKPSNLLKNLAQDNIDGNKTIKDVRENLKKYYSSGIDNRIEFKCDLVSSNIVAILQEKKFELSANYLKYIHRYLFKDVYNFAGFFRSSNIQKMEPILDYDTVIYGDVSYLKDAIEYDISLEKNKNYKEMNIIDIINNIADFTSRIWQIHPFMEGNTRTVAVFIIKYLQSLGINIDISVFKDNSLYFRNALVKSNYYNDYLNITCNNTYLIKFFENLLLGKNNSLFLEEFICNEKII